MSERKTRVLSAVIAAVILCLNVALSLPLPAEAKTVTSFFVICVSGRTTYYEGETFSADGFIGNILYSDGTAESLTGSDLRYKVSSPLTENTTVTFSCSKTSITHVLPITVIGLSSISVGGDFKTDYYAGEDFFDPTGMYVTVSYTDSSSVIFRYNGSSGISIENNCPSTVPVKAEDLIMSPAEGDILSSSVSSVGVSYSIGSHMLSTELPLHVKAVESLEIRSVPSGSFYEGNQFFWENDDLSVYARFSGETEARQVYGYSIPGIDDPMVADFDGKTHYTVILDGQTADFSVTTVPINHFEVTPSGAIQDIYLDHDNIFNPEGIKFAIVYNDAVYVDITAQTVLTYPEVYQAGDTISATYAGFDIPLTNVVRVHTGEIQLILPPNKTEYRVGESFDITGFTAVIKYDDGTGTICPVNEFTYEVSNPLTINDSNVALKWKGLTYNLEIKVLPDAEISINIISEPFTLHYITGQKLDLEGLEVELIRTGMAPETLDRASYTTIPADGETVRYGTNEIIIRYSLSDSVYYETRQPIEVEQRKIVGVYVSKNPTKSIYNEGDTLQSQGLELKINYNDNTTVTTRTGFTFDVTNFVLTSDVSEQNYDVTVYYQGFKCVFTVLVYGKTVDRIEISGNPAIKIYSEGDYFNPEGMRVSVFYTGSPDTPVTLSSDKYSVYPSGRLAAGTNSVEVSFRGHKASVEIIVEGQATTVEETTAVPEDTGIGDESSEEPDITTSPAESHAVTSERKTPVTTSPEVSGTTADTTSGTGSQGGSTGTILLLWIVVIIIIIVALVFLIIYYKRNFT